MPFENKAFELAADYLPFSDLDVQDNADSTTIGVFLDHLEYCIRSGSRQLSPWGYTNFL
jgi:hypothetical protein